MSHLIYTVVSWVHPHSLYTKKTNLKRYSRYILNKKSLNSLKVVLQISLVQSSSYLSSAAVKPCLKLLKVNSMSPRLDEVPTILNIVTWLIFLGFVHPIMGWLFILPNFMRNGGKPTLKFSWFVGLVMG